nr:MULTISPECIES: FimV/HubP family polar landmark protein [unclassified Photobacterium]
MVNANTVRIIGPSSEDGSYSQASRGTDSPTLRSIPQLNTSSLSTRRYGPTGEKETLWSIASRNRPNASVSVYQVIGAIYHVNPQAFENSNIHGLIPGSTLVMPTLSQVKNEKESLIRRQLEADKKRAPYIKAKPATPKRVVKLKPKPEELQKIQAEQAAKKDVKKPQPAEPIVTPVATVTETAKPTTDVPVKTIEKAVAVATTAGVISAATPTELTANTSEAPKTEKVEVADVDNAENTVIPAKPELSEPQKTMTDEQMTKLVESNHMLRLRLAEMQQEVLALKDQVQDSDKVRQEILLFLEQQKEIQQTPQAVTPPTTTWFDSLANNPWALAAAGIIPGGLLAALLAFFLLRRKEDEQDEVKSLNAPEATAVETAPVVSPPVDGNDQALDTSDDLDDLFADDDLFNDTDFTLDIDDKDEPSTKNEKEEVKEPVTEFSDEVDAKTESAVVNDIEFDEAFENNLSRSISVKGDDAIGLEDMERALDEMDNESEPSSDEALALMWEKSLNESAKDEDTENSLDDFDLSQDDFDLSDNDDVKSLPADNEDEELDNGLLEQSLLDEILQQAEEQNQDHETDDVNDKSDDAEVNASENIDQDELDTLFGSFSADLPELDQTIPDASTHQIQDDERVFEEGSTALLDELVEDDELSSDIELEEDSTVLLDELILDDEPEQSDLTIEVAEDSTELLDELLKDNDAESETSSQQDDIAIDESSTELLDEILSEQLAAVDEQDIPNNENQHLDKIVESKSLASDVEQKLKDVIAPENDVEKNAQPEKDISLTDESDADTVEPDTLGAEVVAELPSEEVFNDAFTSELVSDTRDRPSQEVLESQNTEELQTLSPSSEQKFDEILDDVLDEDFYRQSLDSDVKPLTVSDLERELDEQDALASHVAAEQPEPLNVDDLPSFDEEDALKAFADDVYESPQEDAVHQDVLSLDDLPEFDEQAALDDPDAEPFDETELNNDIDEQIALDNVIRQLQQAAEAADKYSPKSELSSENTVDFVAETTPELPDESSLSASAVASENEVSPFDTAQRDVYPFEKLDPTTIPEFDEGEALQASLDEQHELEQYEIEQGLRLPNEELIDVIEKPVVLDQLDQTMVDSAGLDMDALLFDDSLNDNTENDRPSQPIQSQDISDSTTDSSLTDEQPKQQVERSGLGLEDDERDGLLTQTADELVADHTFDDELSDDDAKVWQTSVSEPELAQEDWTQQPHLVKDDVKSVSLESDFSLHSSALENAATSELLTERSIIEKPSYISIDELMKDDPSHQQVDPDANPLNLEVGLDEYPDMLASIGDYDVDTNGEYASKLDLAKAYLEMNDSEGAVGLLEDIAKNAEQDLQAEAKRLLTKL